MRVTQEQTPSANQSRKNRSVLLWLFGIPILVFALSTALYYLVASKTIDLGTVNNGELINPPLPFGELPLTGMDGNDFVYQHSDHPWTFLVIGDSHCENDCERMLYTARQSIIALGKNMHRVRLLYLARGGEISAALQQRLEREYHGIEVISVADEKLRELFAGVKPQPFQPRSFFVVDPGGWLMMAYQAENTGQETLSVLSKAVLKDMKRLLK